MIWPEEGSNTGIKIFVYLYLGEPRTNENSVLISHHTIWLRLHNLVVRGLRRVNPTWTSDQLFNVRLSLNIEVFILEMFFHQLYI